ncbi:MAG: hypothetical protein E6J91_10375 [Deltaproteobacteria bacterium]|nr:MAG: hypothetical protein E6J91_10375 [Deltaproteobacteria bacterium]
MTSGGTIQAVNSANYRDPGVGGGGGLPGVRIFASVYSRTNKELLNLMWHGGAIPAPADGMDWPLDNTAPTPAARD